MRFLRMLSNAVLAGAIAAVYVAALVLHLNPSLRLDDPAAWPLLAAVLLAYGVHLAVVFYAVVVARQVLSTEGLSPGWISYRILAWFCAAAATAAAILMWHNLRGFAVALDPETTRRFLVATWIMTACAAACVVLGLFRLATRPNRLAAVAFVLVVGGSLVLPLVARGPGEPPVPAAHGLTETGPVFTPDPQAGRVVLLAVDAASLDVISPAVADGRLPNFGRLLDGGASMHLATLRPTQPGPVWTAAATGKLPWRNGIRSAATYRAIAGGAEADLLPDFCLAHALVSFGLLSERLQTSGAVRAQPIWTILGRAGLSSSVVRWPLTWPAQPIAGTLVTEEYHRASDVSLALDEPGLTYPPELASRLAGLGRPAVEAAPQALQPEPEGGTVGTAPMALDRFYVTLSGALAAEGPARFTALRLQGLDSVGHVFLRYAMPRAFGDVSEEERGRYGRVFEQYYAYVDTELGRLLDRLAPGDLLLVVSPFGLEPLSLPKRLLERTIGNPAISGTHERAPDGFLLAYGTAVEPGRHPRGAIVDVAPTVLYYFGLPIGRDMDGYARTDLFTPAFTAERPIAYIPTYER